MKYLAYALLALLSLTACSRDTHRVQLRVVSDLVPGREVARITTRTYAGDDATSATEQSSFVRLVRYGEALARGIDVADVEDLTSGTYTFRVAAVKPDGSVITSRPFIVNVTADATYTLVLSADCANVECPNAAGGPALTACLSGTCVDPRCTQDTPEFCPAALFCNDDADCANEASAVCATQACNEGVCVETPTDGACDATEYCARGVGCVSLTEDPPSTGQGDPRCGTVCLLESAACWYGYYACTGETPMPTCTPFYARPEGAPCGQGNVCDAHAECVAGISDGGVPMDGDVPSDASIRDSGLRDSGPRDGSRPDGTIDRCATMPCAPGTCMNVPGNYVCSCPSGYEPGIGSRSCEDIDECATRTSTCTQSQHCVNTPGSFECKRALSFDVGEYQVCAIFEGNVLKCTGGEGWGGADGVISFTGSQPATIQTQGENFCATRASGELTCWGRNESGQLGYGDDAYRSAPADLVIDLGVGRTALGFGMSWNHMCALLDDHSVKCWGNNDYGQLGYGDMAGRASPPGAPIDLDGAVVTNIAVGSLHGCALIEDGSVRCWGYNVQGQLGYGDTASRLTPGPIVNLGTGRTARALVASNATTCAVLDDDSLKCWGGSVNGAFSLGDTSDRLSPTVVNTNGRGVQSLSATPLCAVLRDSSTICWGDNSKGQLGYGDGNDRAAVTSPPIDLGAARHAIQVAGASAHACAMLDDASITCWGENYNGQLGYRDRPIRYTPGDGIELGGGRTVIDLAGGGRQTCVVLDDGSAYCWGTMLFDSVRDAQRRAPGHALDLGGARLATQIAASSTAVCATLDDDAERCWPWGTPASDIDFGGGRTAKHIAAARNELNCVILDDDSLRCWGINGTAGLGLGDSIARPDPSMTPSLDFGGQAVIDASHNGAYGCAVLAGGSLACWGNNNQGQLGVGDTTDRSLPTQVNLGSRDAVRVFTAQDNNAATHTCAIIDGGSALCWGDNVYGQLGLGDRTSRSSPPLDTIDLGAGRTATELAVGYGFTCALLDDGSVKCWGYSSDGQLGIESIFSDTSAPGTAVDLGGLRATQILAGERHVCVVLEDGNVSCWGANYDAQLGDGVGLYWEPGGPLNFRDL